MDIDIQIIQPQQSNRIIDIKAQGQSLDEILALLEGTGVRGEFGVSQLNSLILNVHADLQLEVLTERGVDLRPGGFDGGKAVRRDGDFAGFDVDDSVSGWLFLRENGS